MWSDIGKNININIFGESHGPAIGVVINGLPAGVKIDMQKVYLEMSRRAPGNKEISTSRKEADFPDVVSGMFNDTLTGAPLCAIIQNTSQHSGDYSNILKNPRPSHADYPAFIKYGGFADMRGGGHFSGRLTAPLVFAGAIAKQIIAAKGVKIYSHVLSVGGHYDAHLSEETPQEVLERLESVAFPVIDSQAEKAMRDEIAAARAEQDSVGGTVELMATGIPAGIGNPMFAGIENIIAATVFGIPAVKGLEFGKGFELAEMRGSEANDQFTVSDGKVKTVSNNNGGITGGISNGMPLILRAAIKPTPSIGKPQKSVNLDSMSESTLEIKGRHDPCIVSRAAVCIEAAVAVSLLDIMKGDGAI